jgi:hypothetical protein
LVALKVSDGITACGDSNGSEPEDEMLVFVGG